MTSRLTILKELPFVYFSASLPKDPSPFLLHATYKDLLKRAYEATQEFGPTFPRDDSTQSIISYNLGLTDRAMVICPRKSEGSKIRNDNGELVGPVALNGSLLAGTLLAKSNAEWEALQHDHDESKLIQILRAIGVPRVPSCDESKPQITSYVTAGARS